MPRITEIDIEKSSDEVKEPSPLILLQVTD